ncbi:MAG TPA: hypothetical protein VJU84_07130 [Pyrinomonadaceae bacterium]|nr:hypothetical protein [Pyrinomonadaceae bacterium]
MLSQSATKTWMTGNLFVAAGDSAVDAATLGRAEVGAGIEEEQAATDIAPIQTASVIVLFNLLNQQCTVF